MGRANLSLGNLHRAVSGSARTSQQVSIRQLNGGGSNISMQGFATDAITGNTPSFTYIVEGTGEVASFQFSLTGSSFYNKVQQQTNNYQVSFGSGPFSVGGRDYNTGPTRIAVSASNLVNSGLPSYYELSSELSMQYADGFNFDATNYNRLYQKTLFAVDVYNTINQPDFCLLSDTPITKADGTIVNVEDLVVGDVIKSWVPAGLPDESLDGTDTEETEWRFFQKETNEGSYAEVTVKDITFNFASGYYNINNGLIKSTGTHPLWVFSYEIQKYTFKEVEHILPGDSIVLFDEEDGISEVLVYDISKVIEDVEIVTLNVENSDVYLSNGAISHNKGGVSTSQSSIPPSGLRMYLDPGKTASFSSGVLPATGTPSVDFLDLSGYGLSVRPGAQGPLSLANANPSYNNGASKKERYYSFDGGDLFYKDTASNINGGYSQLNTTSGTIHMWVRQTTNMTNTIRPIFDYGGFYLLTLGSPTNTSVSNMRLSGSGLGTPSQTNISWNQNTWYMVSATFQSGNTCTLYLDGTSVGTFTSSGWSAPASTNYLTIGASSPRTNFWVGHIGPVLFYNTLQDATAVQRVYSYFSPTYK
jgi:hypothetical protein